MGAFRATKSSDVISLWSTLGATIGGGGVLVFVALPLALSSPYPTVKDKAWIVENEPVRSSVVLASVGSMTLASAAPEGAEPILITGSTTTVAARQAAAPERIAPADASTDMLSWEPTLNLASLPMATVDPDALTIGPSTAAPSRSRPRGFKEMVDDYLWEVYLRQPIKKDGSGDFTWKDPAAAKRAGLNLREYVIGGMDRDFRENLYHAGQAMDEAGLQWSMLSAFRDDYRQSLAAGFKASTGNSLHGGSRRTGGYGHGRAVDVTIAANSGVEASTIWHWFDRNGARYGISRPMPGRDPAHIQATTNWQKIAATLRAKRSLLANADQDSDKAER